MAESHAHSHRHFVPAAGADWLLPFYDPFTRLLGTASALRRLAEQAELSPGQRVLDLGCGTGALTLVAKRAQPGIEIVGLDPDAKALARARRKAERAGLAIEFQQGFGDALPFPDASFDRVLSSFMFHHLEAAQKPAVLREVFRVLRPAGSLHLVDFGGAGHGIGAFLARLVHREESLRANTDDALTRAMRDAGFAEAAETEQRGSLVGQLIYHRATPSDS
jgi:ubiquinone/menaquinone biosynthesis C-methylase UbiE